MSQQIMMSIRFRRRRGALSRRGVWRNFFWLFQAYDYYLTLVFLLLLKATPQQSLSWAPSIILAPRSSSSSQRASSHTFRTSSAAHTRVFMVSMELPPASKKNKAAAELQPRSHSHDNSHNSLSEFDPDLATLIAQEEHRQRSGLELIASENFCSANVRRILGSCLTNKYSEGNVGQRYYGGNEFIDQIETLCMERALQLYQLNPSEWGVNVQPYSGSPANFAVYTALLEPHDRLMGLDLPSGGHLTHGFRTAKRKVSATSVYFESLPYQVNPDSGYIDYDELERRAQLFLPKLLIAGASAYPREWDYARMRHIANQVGALLMVDMAHISGLVASGVAQSPFDYADIVTSTTHKTLRGPRSGMIFARQPHMDAINAAVFPSLQGGPHNHQIGALAVALKEAQQPAFAQYGRQVVANAQALAAGLVKRGHVLSTGGTDNHLLLWNVRRICNGMTGSKVEKVLELASMTTNKNSIPGDTSALNPGGVRLGTPALTTRGLTEHDFEHVVADFLDRGSRIATRAQELALSDVQGRDPTKSKVLLKEFLAVLEGNDQLQQDIAQLRSEVEEFALAFDMP